MTNNTLDNHYTKIVELFNSIHVPAKVREAILKEHHSILKDQENKMLEFVLPEKVAGCSEHPLGSKDCKRWHRCPAIYERNQAIDEIRQRAKEWSKKNG